MEVVHFPETKNALEKFESNMDAESREILRVFDCKLFATFSDNQTLALVAGYASALTTKEEAYRDAEMLCRYYTRKQWTQEEMEEFQIIMLSKPGMDGIAVAFEHHPMFKRLIEADTSGGNIYRNDLYEEENDNNSLSSLVVLRNKGSISFGDSDDEEVQESKTVKREGYRVHEPIMTDDGAIKNLYIPVKCKGVVCTFQGTISDDKSHPISSNFDLLRAVVFPKNHIIIITCITPNNKTSPIWRKEIAAHAGVRYNFAENLVPQEEATCRFLLKIVNHGKSEEEYTIIGIHLNKEERTKQRVNLIRNEFDPFQYGFYPSSGM
jgi:hypothetical protein